MVDNHNDKKLYKNIFLIGLFLLSFVFNNILLSSILFIFNIDINSSTVFLSAIISILIELVFIKKNNMPKKSTILTILIPIIFIIISIIICGKFYDYTWDGRMYHKVGIGYLMDGWNPLNEDVEEYDKTMTPPFKLIERNYLWINHYPKASYIFAANIGKLTGNIESGKAINIISIAALFCFTLSILIYKKKSMPFSILFSLAIVSCTTILSQILTNYVDCLVYVYMFMLIYTFFAFEEKSYISNKTVLLIYFMVLGLLINIKFSSFAFAGIYCLAYYLWYIFRLKFKKIDKKFFVNFTITSFIAVIIGVFVIGLTSYPKNYIEKGNPFYPLLGKNKVDIMTNEALDYFENKSPIERFMISTYSQITNLSKASGIEATLKVPFTIHKKELKYIDTCETRISGNGLLFSGIFSISLIVILLLEKRLYKDDKKLFVLTTIPTLVTILLTFLMQDIWWARYFPQIHFIVFLALILLEKYTNKKFLLYGLITIIIINGSIFMIGNINNAIKHTDLVKEQFNYIKSKKEFKKCKMKIWSLTFQGGYFDIEKELKDYNIIYTNKKIDNYEYVLNGGYACGICVKEKKE